LATSPLRLTTGIFFQLNTCFHSPYVTSSLTIGWVCNLQSPLALIIAVILRSDSRGTRGHTLLPQIRTSPNLEGQTPIFISPRNRVAQLYPQELGSLFVVSTTYRATVEVFDLSSRRERFAVAPIVFKITPRHGPRGKHRPSLVAEVCLLRRCIATFAARITQKTPFCWRAHILRALPSNGRCLPSHSLATGLYATI
jgi:hypothetical protein